MPLLPISFPHSYPIPEHSIHEKIFSPQSCAFVSPKPALLSALPFAANGTTEPAWKNLPTLTWSSSVAKDRYCVVKLYLLPLRAQVFAARRLFLETVFVVEDQEMIGVRHAFSMQATEPSSSAEWFSDVENRVSAAGKLVNPISGLE